jgi:hypothetical protein
MVAHQIRKSIRNVVHIGILFCFLFFSLNSPNFPIITLSGDPNIQADTPETSVVAGSEMYSEQLSAYIVGDTSIIKQGYITNDSNILNGFNYDDPAFHECSILIASSNGIIPEMFPTPFSESAFGSDKFLSYDCFYGFLYYNPASGKTIEDRATRALEIIENLFDIQLFMLDTFSEDFFFPFFGFYPDWDDYFNLVISNAPQDGYWGAIDTDRLLTEEYLTQKHISSYILMLDSVDVLTEGFDFPQGYEQFEIDQITTSFADISEISGVFSSVFDLLNFTSDAFSMFDTSRLLEGNSKYITTIIQYEGKEEGLQRVSENIYDFDLMKALNYNVTHRGALGPSKKIYISLTGALLTEIDISIYSSDILSFKPLYNTFSTYILDSIVEAAFLLGQNLDISIISNYSLRTFWRTDDAVNRIVTNLYDHATIDNPLNLITTLSLTGLPVIPTGILEPLKEFQIQFAVNSTEPVLRIQKDYRFYSYDTGNYDIDITITNEGEIPAWGKKIEFPVLNQTFLPIPEVLTTLIENEYGMSAEEYLIPDEPLRFLFVDSLGSGFYDYLYPQVTNLTQLTFYKPEFAEEILDPIHDDYFNSSGVSESERDLYAEIFNQTDSIFNPDNWKLDPGEKITYTISGLSIEPFYNYTSFYDLNFTITEDDLEPYVAYGETLSPSEPINATTIDGTTWDLISEQIGEDNIIQVYFSFENSTPIDLYSYSLDQIGLECVFSSNLNLDMDTQFVLEFYNTSSMQFEVISNAVYSASSSNIEFLTPSNIIDYIDPDNNYQSIFKLTFTTNSIQILSIEQILLQFYDRDLDLIEESPAVVAYSTFTGYNTYFIDSNPIPAVSDPSPILIAYADLEHYNSTPGMLNKYNLTIQNIGDLEAIDVNVTLKTPGIIKDPGNFTIINGYLIFNISTIHVDQKIQNLTFQFYTPNSNNLPLADIDYNHPITLLNSTEADFTTHPNDLFLSAPIDYKNYIPFVYTIKFSYASNFTDASSPGGVAPQEGDIFRLDLVVENTSNITLSDINVSIPDNVVGLRRLDNESEFFSNIGPNTSKISSTLINKTQWNSLLFPNIDKFLSTQKFLIQIERNCPIILGYINFTIEKTFSDYDGTRKSIISVQINVTNTGNIHVHDLTVIDFAGYPKEGFSLMSGTPDRFISTLMPGEKFIYTYTLRMEKQGLFEITPALIQYDYIEKMNAYSSPFTVKVRNNWFVNALYVLLPTIIGGVVTGLVYWSKKRYDLEAAEFARREELMFGQDLRSIAWNKKSIQEELLDLQESEENKQKKGDEK